MSDLHAYQVIWFGSSGMRHIRGYLSLFAGVCALLFGMAAHAAIPAPERAALLNLYAYTDGIHWDPDHQAGWNGPPGTECGWYGITCDASGSTVTGIDLAGAGLYGPLPSLSALKNLETFDIHQTATGGIGGYNVLLGSIPPLNGLTKLRVFIATNTSFSGGIPPLTGLTSLQHFQIRGCQLSGDIPPLDGLINLAYFDVSKNQLTGSLPALTGLASISYFDVSDNHLVGAIPNLNGLNNLTEFDVNGNQLTSNIPNLVGLSNLKIFAADGNLLKGGLPALAGLTNLTAFYADANLLTGGIPPLDGTPNLQKFGVGFNHLTGSIPDLSQLSNLQDFYVGFNQLTGQVPAPPSSLVSAALCPNNLIPASTPPSAIDLAWNTATYTTPWSTDCVPGPKWKSALSVSSSLNPSSVGQPVTFTAVIWGMNPTGTVTFTARSDAPSNTQTLCDSVPLVGSIATCMVSTIPPSNSTYTMVATYSGDADNAPANNLVVGTLSTLYQFVAYALAETTTANPAQVGQPVDLTATLVGGQDTDTLTFYDGQAPLCDNVPVHTIQAQQVGHCVTQFATAGPHSLTVQNYRGGGASLPLMENITSPAQFDADQFALTGSWYNPPTSGQGLEIEVYPDLNGAGAGLLFGGWFTYDASGNPQWVTLQGNLSSSHGASYALGIGQNTGGNFNAPPTTQAVAIGSATLTFYDCTHAALIYQFSDGRSGTIPYVRLTAPSACSGAVPAVTPAPMPANYNDVLHSGAWFDPSTSGQGLLVDIVPAQNLFFAAWYTYAPLTEGLTGLAGQRWFTLQSDSYTPRNLNLSNVPIVLTSGGIFNTPTAVNNVQVGSADITFGSCNTMTLKYTFTQGEFSGLSGIIEERALGPTGGCH